MIRSKRRLGVVLGLCLLALGLVGASSAQATMHWNVEGKPLAAATEVEAALDEVGILHTKIGGNTVLFECKKGELKEVFLELEGKVKGGDVKFSECVTRINGTVNPVCEPIGPLGEKGVILTNPGDGLIVLHKLEKDGVLADITSFESLVKETIGGVSEFVFARIKMSTECPIGSNIPVIGPRVTLIDITNGVADGKEILKELLTHLVEVGPLTELWALSLTEEHKATILGKAKVNLVNDKLWSGDPE